MGTDTRFDPAIVPAFSDSLIDGNDSSICSDTMDDLVNAQNLSKCGNTAISISCCASMPGLKLCHLNSQSLPSHIKELLALFTDLNFFDVVGISETWLKPWMGNNMIDMPGFDVIRNDR